MVSLVAIVIFWLVLGALGFIALRALIAEGESLPWTNGDTVFLVFLATTGPVIWLYVMLFGLLIGVGKLTETDWFNR